jgi:hypothetical protein
VANFVRFALNSSITFDVVEFEVDVAWPLRSDARSSSRPTTMEFIPSAVLDEVSRLEGKKPKAHRKFIQSAKESVTSPRGKHRSDIEDLAFVYERPEDIGQSSQDAVDPHHLHLVTPGFHQPPQNHYQNKHEAQQHPQQPPHPNQSEILPHGLKPATRKEVVLLRTTMLKLLDDIGVTHDDSKAYPTEMHAFMEIIQSEQKIYDQVFQEIIHQVAVHMFERGSVI